VQVGLEEAFLKIRTSFHNSHLCIAGIILY